MFGVKRRINKKNEKKSNALNGIVGSTQAGIPKSATTPTMSTSTTGRANASTEHGMRGCLKTDTHSDHSQELNSLLSRSSGVSPASDSFYSSQSTGRSLGTTATFGHSTTTPPPDMAVKKVGFQHVKLREFERVLSDNPSCSSGAPIGIGWAHSRERTMPIDDYEAARPSRRGQLDLILTRQEREALLLEWGATFHEIIDAIRTNVRVKNQRRRTVHAIGTYDRWEEVFESAGRKIKRTFSIPKPSRRKSWEKVPALTAPHTGRPPPLLDAPSHHDDEDMDSLASNHNPMDMMKNSTARVASTEQEPQVIFSLQVEESETAAEIDGDAADDLLLSADYDVFHHEQPPPPARKIEVANFEYSSYLHPTNHHHPSYEGEFTQYPPPTTGAPNDLALYYHLSAISSNISLISQDRDQDSSEGFESLRRDHSFWELEGLDAPGIKRKITPVIISEDGDYGMHDFEEDRSLFGFTVQPPPRSNAITRSWE